MHSTDPHLEVMSRVPAVADLTTPFVKCEGLGGREGGDAGGEEEEGGVKVLYKVCEPIFLVR